VFAAKIGALLFEPFVAFLFWFVMVVLIIFATVEGKDSPITAFFIAFGAAGQVFLALMVYRLSRQQFDFQRKAEERQRQIDLYPLRLEAYERFKKLGETIYGSRMMRFGDTFIEEFYAAGNQARYVFTDDVVEAINAFEDSAEKVFGMRPERHEAWTPEELALWTKANENLADHFVDTDNRMTFELKIR